MFTPRVVEDCKWEQKADAGQERRQLNHVPPIESVVAEISFGQRSQGLENSSNVRYLCTMQAPLSFVSYTFCGVKEVISAFLQDRDFPSPSFLVSPNLSFNPCTRLSASGF